MSVRVLGPASVQGAPAGAPFLARPFRREQATVLLVDDDGHCRSGLRRHLLQAGFAVCEAANGLEALHFLRRCQVDVLATDICMPTLDGLALVEALGTEHPTLPVVAYSGALLLDPTLDRRLRA